MPAAPTGRPRSQVMCIAALCAMRMTVSRETGGTWFPLPLRAGGPGPQAGVGGNLVAPYLHPVGGFVRAQPSHAHYLVTAGMEVGGWRPAVGQSPGQIEQKNNPAKKPACAPLSNSSQRGACQAPR